MTIKTALLRAAAIAALALSASACASGPGFYPEVAAGQPAAELYFFKTYQGTAVGKGAAIQQYALATDEFCDTAKLAASFTWTTGDEKALRVTPEQPVVLWVGTDYISTASVSMVGGAPVPNMAERVCRNAVRFTPQRDRLYDIKQDTEFDADGCNLIITDRATGQVVTDGVEVLQLGQCRQRTAA